jgi:hypothetical protein
VEVTATSSGDVRATSEYARSIGPPWVRLALETGSIRDLVTARAALANGEPTTVKCVPRRAGADREARHATTCE